ncbi:MAG: anion permease [Bryobacterales bacterium]|nr:inorganic phosphate transporter [Bryobacteraceae bacterium]MDW8131374.1 anion permease [Bryobacterales bacterium]
MSLLTLVVIIIVLALVFDFLNGFHDAANSIATVVATRVLSPLQAVVWAAFFNFISAFSFGTGVAKTVGAGMVDLKVVTLYVILAGLIGAIIWLIITWWFGLPISCSHALFGGYAGAAMARVALLEGLGSATKALIWSGWTKTVLFMVLAPLIGLALAYLYMIAIYWIFRHHSPRKMDVYFRRLQLLSAAAYSYSHGTNDAQKTMGIITAVLVTAGYLPDFRVPMWVILAAHAAIALGTLAGGWRIVETMGTRITRLRPRGGFAAETAAATSILLSTALHVGVSTTHVITGGIAGVGSIQRRKAVRWSVATRIVWAWILTIPASAVMAWISYWLLYRAGLDIG